MFTSLRRCLVLLGPEGRARWVAVIGLAIVVAGLEALSALVVFGLLTRITSEASGFDLPVIGDLREVFPGASETTIMTVVGVLIVLFFLVRAAIVIGQAYLQYQSAEDAGARLSTRLFAGYLAMPHTFHLQRNSSELVRNAYDNVRQFSREALVPAVKLVSHTCVIIGLSLVLVATSPLATLAALGFLGPVTWAMTRVVHPRVKRLGSRAQGHSRRSLQTLQESLEGWRDVTVLGRRRFYVDAFAREREGLARAKYLRSTASELPRMVIETALILFILGFLAVNVLISGGALEALPVLGLFGYTAVRMQPSLQEVMVALNSLKFAEAGISFVHEDVLRFPAPERVDDEELDRTPRFPLTDELRLEGVHVRYPGSHEEALRDIDLTIRAGEFVGIVGPTGGGKSTLVDVLLGLLPPTEGSVTVDGQPLAEHTAGWHANLGVVHQSIFLADTSLRRNIALGVAEDDVDDDRVREAVRLAQLEDFVASLPDGLDSVVGERGARVSGGQRQRVAIARALYRRPGVLILDEGTSALDQTTEGQLMDQLELLRRERTVITVAHRLSTVRRCDRVVLLDEGRIVDVAPFDELASRHAQLLQVTA
ncbi:MAG: ABC transporter ATP-binding protein [Nitriliruptor sp.]